MGHARSTCMHTGLSPELFQQLIVVILLVQTISAIQLVLHHQALSSDSGLAPVLELSSVLLLLLFFCSGNILGHPRGRVYACAAVAPGRSWLCVRGGPWLLVALCSRWPLASRGSVFGLAPGPLLSVSSTTVMKITFSVCVPVDNQTYSCWKPEH